MPKETPSEPIKQTPTPFGCEQLMMFKNPFMIEPSSTQMLSNLFMPLTKQTVAAQVDTPKQTMAATTSSPMQTMATPGSDQKLEKPKVPLFEPATHASAQKDKVTPI